ncbi:MULTISPECIES: DoxX family membrane protein [unclassified Paenibacillus]|uniref:DoxX family protein n=1 Tax=unclassified Paenibacillus TaxID=185978 RepID=UPI001AE96178|nr:MULTISPECIES: DoxX family membrane protein [unclassified Paenibacillus]MBP1155589.1 putative oxidoreductase [Paenibacillus sp. PvP091]MBP1169025.1 putative oxidoreductase [Paenibacillus sp. PvR098]MBP2440053.1 putative oxidoreductase [Paenibacillus sp. PvP052]
MIDIGLLIIRLVVGLTFMGHGAQKMFGWFNGPGLKGTPGWLVSIITVHGKNGYWATAGGYEYNLILIAIAIGVALIEPGNYVLF